MAAPLKLTDADVKRIRRRVRRGEQLTALAAEYGVNRKTIRRRLDALDKSEREQAERTARKRLQRQAAREKRKLLERPRAVARSPVEDSEPRNPRGLGSMRPRNYYFDWLDTRKNLSGRAPAEAKGLVRLARGRERRWVERSDADWYFDDGWVLEDSV
jgi:hypothetical protein